MNPKKIAIDKDTKAIINTDLDGLVAYKAKRDQRNKINELEDDINSVKEDLTEIKNLLKEIIKNRE